MNLDGLDKPFCKQFPGNSQDSLLNGAQFEHVLLNSPTLLQIFKKPLKFPQKFLKTISFNSNDQQNLHSLTISGSVKLAV